MGTRTVKCVCVCDVVQNRVSFSLCCAALQFLFLLAIRDYCDWRCKVTLFLQLVPLRLFKTSHLVTITTLIIRVILLTNILTTRILFRLDDAAHLRPHRPRRFSFLWRHQPTTGRSHPPCASDLVLTFCTCSSFVLAASPSTDNNLSQQHQQQHFASHNDRFLAQSSRSPTLVCPSCAASLVHLQP